MGGFIDLTGKTFYRWTVTKLVGPSMWLCICECGQERYINGQSIRDGKSKSCGCLRVENTKKMRLKHGQSHRNKTITYNSWVSMMQRCANENRKNFHYYGGRGIVVCERWSSSFENFLKDMGERPSMNYSLDRKDNDGNYEPSNCKWSTKSEQMINRRIYSSNTSGVKGVYLQKKSKSWKAMIFIDRKGIDLGYFKIKEDAIEARRNAEIKYWGKESS